MDVTNTTNSELVRALKIQDQKINGLKEVVKLQTEFNEAMIIGYEKSVQTMVGMTSVILVLMVVLAVVSGLYIRLSRGRLKQL